VDNHLTGARRLPRDRPRGKVEATVEVDELVVGGEFAGEAVARRRVELLASGRVSGRLRAPSFALAEGCVFDGQWETVPAGAEASARAPEEGPRELEEAAAAP
jgi:cytoskeletal protein CcmA (bactofilin family)